MESILLKKQKYFLIYSDDMSKLEDYSKIANAFNLNMKSHQNIESLLNAHSSDHPFFSVIDLNYQYDSFPNYKSYLTLDLSPVFLITKITDQYTYTHYLNIADDFLFEPMHIDNFQLLYFFWLQPSTMFNSFPLKKLIMASNTDLVSKILKSFTTSLFNVYKKSISALQENNLFEISKATHSIKASAKMLGAEDLYFTCQLIEFKKSQGTPMSERFKIVFERKLNENLDYFNKLSTLPLDKIV